MILEGVFHALLMILLLVPVVACLMAVVMPAAVEAMGSWCTVYRFSLLPLWLLVPVILLSAVTIPLICLRSVTKGSLTGRMRHTE